MPTTFVFFLIVTALAIAALVVAVKVKRTAIADETENEKYVEDKANYGRLPHPDVDANFSLARIIRYVGMVLVGLAALLLLSSTFYVVPVRNVGIVTNFSSPTGRYTGNGLKAVWPWQEVADFDASKITSDHTGKDRCITARIGSLATACVEAKITVQVNEEAAPQLYKDYKGDFDNLRNNYIELNIQNAVNAVFATYNPLSQVNLQTGQVTFDGARLADQVKTQLETAMGNNIRVWIVSIPLIHHDAKTEQNIQQFQDVIAQSRILAQQKANADLEAQVAATQRSYLTPEFIKNKCIEASIKMGVPPGLCLVGNGAIVDTTK